METGLAQKLCSKQITKAQLYKKVENDFSLVPQLIKGISSPKATVRYGCGSVLVDLSANYPSRLYPYMDRFISLLDNKHRIITWNALAIVANLTAVDTDHKFDTILDRYFDFLGNEYLVTVANTVTNSAAIAKNKPYLADQIATELLKVANLQTTPHLTEECKLVIAEHTIETFNSLITLTENKRSLLAFAQQYKNSSREKLQKKAQKFLEKWQ